MKIGSLVVCFYNINPEKTLSLFVARCYICTRSGPATAG